MAASSIAGLRAELLASFEAMLQQLDLFSARVRQDSSLPAWVSLTEEELSSASEMRHKAIQLYRALWYQKNQDGRETLTCPGIIGASPETLQAAFACNNAKDAFKAVVLSLKRIGQKQADQIVADLHQRHEIIGVALQRMGATRLNLKQAYRHIPLLDQRPLKIGFTWSKQGRVIQRTSVATARRLLEQRIETPQIRVELQRLAELGDNEMLARVRSVCPHLRANIVFPEIQGVHQRRLMQAPLPILVPLHPGEGLPEFVPVAPSPPVSLRLRRADVRIEDELFLPSVRIYRYRASYRGN